MKVKTKLIEFALFIVNLKVQNLNPFIDWTKLNLKFVKLISQNKEK